MQQLQADLNTNNDLKVVRPAKKSKKSISAKKASGKGVQFANILQQVSIPTTTPTETKVKEIKTSKPEIRADNAILKELRGMPTKSDRNPIQKAKINLTDYITEKNNRVLEKATDKNSRDNILKDSKSQKLIQKASFNNNALQKNENRGRISDIQIIREKISLKLNVESKTTPDNAGIILDKLVEADIQNNVEIGLKEGNSKTFKVKLNRESKTAPDSAGSTLDKMVKTDIQNNVEMGSKGDNSKISKAEPQFNGSIIHSKVEPQAIDKQLIQKRDTDSKDQIKQEKSIPINKLDGYLQNEQVKKQTKENAAESDTPKAKTEIYNNQIITSKTGLSHMTKITEPNLEKTMLSQSQTDLIVTKMVDQIKSGPGSLEVSLKPEYLGKLNILFQSNEGSILIKVVAQNVDAVNLLNSSLQNIKENLEQQGIKVQQIEVNLANQEKHGNQTGYSRDGTKHQNSFGKPKFSNYEPRETISLLPYKLNILA